MPLFQPPSWDSQSADVGPARAAVERAEEAALMAEQNLSFAIGTPYYAEGVAGIANAWANIAQARAALGLR
jgi:hypothetical protein